MENIYICISHRIPHIPKLPTRFGVYFRAGCGTLSWKDGEVRFSTLFFFFSRWRCFGEPKDADLTWENDGYPWISARLCLLVGRVGGNHCSVLGAIYLEINWDGGLLDPTWCFCAQIELELELFSHMEGYAVREGKSRPTAPKWARVASQNQRNVSQGPCMPRAVLTATSNAKTFVQPAAMHRTLSATPRHRPTSKLTYFRLRQRWFLGSGARFACAYPHTSRGSSVKFTIRLAAKPQRMSSKATKEDFAICIGQTPYDTLW